MQRGTVLHPLLWKERGRIPITEGQEGPVPPSCPPTRQPRGDADAAQGQAKSCLTLRTPRIAQKGMSREGSRDGNLQRDTGKAKEGPCGPCPSNGIWPKTEQNQIKRKLPCTAACLPLLSPCPLSQRCSRALKYQGCSSGSSGGEQRRRRAPRHPSAPPPAQRPQ